MNYGKINTTDIANGTGVRVSLFVSGCRIRCPGCFNPEAQNFAYGEVFTLDTMGEILNALEPKHIEGLTILGGEPLDEMNRITVLYIVQEVKRICPDKTIWIYTGYPYDRVKNLDIMRYIDVLVDGAFMEKYKDISLKFKGSANQRVIDVRETRKTGKIVLMNV